MSFEGSYERNKHELKQTILGSALDQKWSEQASLNRWQLRWKDEEERSSLWLDQWEEHTWVHGGSRVRMRWLCLGNRNPRVSKARRVRLGSCMRRGNGKVDRNLSSKASENVASCANFFPLSPQRSYAGEVHKLLKIHVLRSSVWLLCINWTGVEQNWNGNITYSLGTVGEET